MRIKNHTRSKFRKYFGGCCAREGLLVVHPQCGFSVRRQITPEHTTKFRTARFRQFHSTLIYGSIWAQFPPSVGGRDVLYNALNIS